MTKYTGRIIRVDERGIKYRWELQGDGCHLTMGYASTQWGCRRELKRAARQKRWEEMPIDEIEL